MTTSDDGSSDALTEEELGLLDELRGLYTELDAMPPNLVAHTHFALELDDVGFQLARPDPHREFAGAASRGADQAQYIPFESDVLTMIVSVGRNDDDTRRVDGHVTPPGVHSVRIRTSAGVLDTESDEDGRFQLDQLPAGPTQFLVRVGDTPVVSPAVTI